MHTWKTLSSVHSKHRRKAAPHITNTEVIMIVSRTASLAAIFFDPEDIRITESASGVLTPPKPILLTLDFVGGFSG